MVFFTYLEDAFEEVDGDGGAEEVRMHAVDGARHGEGRERGDEQQHPESAARCCCCCVSRPWPPPPRQRQNLE